RPPGGADVVAQHPERRPDALPAGDLDARLEVPVLLREQARGVEARRGVLAGPVPARVVAGAVLRGRDDEVAALDDGVLGARRVVLELVVPPAAAAGVVAPLARIDRGAIGPVELV